MKTIIFATSNKDKMRELREILKDCPFEIKTMKEAGLAPDIDENGSSFEENAMIKAKAVISLCKGLEGDIIAMADDSGLEVDYLDKAPGIYSARFLGEDTSYDIKNGYILDKLKGVPDEKRTARFVCAIAAVDKNGREAVVRGTIEGIIGHRIAGENGFGYDPIFYLPERGCTTAELPREEKNAISHRGRAIEKIKKIVSEW
jgi:XTP/dITP diphosphohydrolase